MSFTRRGDHTLLNVNRQHVNSSLRDAAGDLALKPGPGSSSGELWNRVKINKIVNENHSLQREIQQLHRNIKFIQEQLETSRKDNLAVRSHVDSRVAPSGKQVEQMKKLNTLLLDRLCYVLSILSKDPQGLVIEYIPELLLVLDRLPYLDDRLYKIGKQLKESLTNPSASVAAKLRSIMPKDLNLKGNQILLLLERMKRETEFTPTGELDPTSGKELSVLDNLLQFKAPFELKFIAAALNDPTWLAYSDIWRHLPVCLRYAAVTTMDKGWIAYRDMYTNCDIELRFLAFSLSDYRWLHNHKKWRSMTIDERLKAVRKRDPLLVNVEGYTLMPNEPAGKKNN